MNIEYLKNEIIPQREKEIAEDKNLGTRQPIYVVLDLNWFPVSGHTDYKANINYKGMPSEYGYIDAGDNEFQLNKKGLENPHKITKIYYDRIIAFFLTSKGAHEYIKYQAHNLKNPYVYVFYSGYANQEMNMLLQNS